jgi:hypothetical protein
MIELVGDLTMVRVGFRFIASYSAFLKLYYAANAVLNPAKFTLTTIAMLQHSESILRRTFYSGIEQIAELRQSMNFMKRIYGVRDIANVIKDGSLKYPESVQSEQAGMTIDFRYQI